MMHSFPRSRLHYLNIAKCWILGQFNPILKLHATRLYSIKASPFEWQIGQTLVESQCTEITPDHVSSFNPGCEHNQIYYDGYVDS